MCSQEMSTVLKSIGNCDGRWFQTVVKTIDRNAVVGVASGNSCIESFGSLFFVTPS